jgi:hypothetical protein
MDVIHPNPVIDGVRVASASGVRSPALSAFLDGVEISEDGVREVVFAQRLPQVLGGARPGSAQKLRDLGRRTAKRRANQHALDARVLRVAAGLLQALGKPCHCWLVSNDQTLHPRLLEVRGGA